MHHTNSFKRPSQYVNLLSAGLNAIGINLNSHTSHRSVANLQILSSITGVSVCPHAGVSSSDASLCLVRSWPVRPFRRFFRLPPVPIRPRRSCSSPWSSAPRSAPLPLFVRLADQTNVGSSISSPDHNPQFLVEGGRDVARRGLLGLPLATISLR